MPLYGDRKRQYDVEYRSQRREAWIDSQGRKCALCDNEDGPWEIDHIDPSTKLYRISTVWTRVESVRLAELAKCQLLCESCHHVKSAQENERPVTHGMSGYRRGCRCKVCSDGLRQYWRQRRAAV